MIESLLQCCGFQGDLQSYNHACSRSTTQHTCCNDNGDDESDPAKAKTFLQRGCIYQEGKNFEKAIILYKQALQLDPTSIDAHYNLATVLHNLNRVEDAIKFYKRTISLKQDHQQSFYNLGYIFYDQKNYQDSIKYFTRAAELNCDDLDAHVNLGLAYKESGRLHQAVCCYNRAISLKPDYIPAVLNLGEDILCETYLNSFYNRMSDIGIIHATKKEYIRALLHFEKVLQIDPNNEKALKLLGQCQQSGKIVG